MMREILFRGKRFYDDEWAFGFVAKIDIYRYGKEYEETVIVRQLKYDDRDLYVQEFIYADAVDPDTVGQYTGLKDQNGVEIYEGDIVTFLGIQWDGPDGDRVDYVGVVRYSDEYTAFTFEISNGMQATTFGMDEIEVIGNIHENPELIAVEVIRDCGGMD